MNISRRSLVTSGLLGGAMLYANRTALAASPAATFTLPDSEWRKRLSTEAYMVLRHSATEPPFTSVLLKEHRNGTFLCAGCRLPLFSSASKYESGTGWPSFWRPLPGAIATSVDHEIGMVRTEVHCQRCAGHLGHVFNDGPRPTGQRYCMNGVALTFQPRTA